MTRRISLSLLATLAGCQPQARRLLLLDLNLTDPVALDASAQPWVQAGYTVEYRRFYPHLTRQDLSRYRVVVLLGGREPEGVSDAIDQGDLALLTEWVPRGGVLVFGYSGDGEGFGDRWTMNRWLDAVGAGITIGDFALRDTTGAGAAPGGALRRAESESFPDGRSHVLLARDPVQALARAGPASYVVPPGQPSRPRPRAAVVAADRVGDGLVVVASRHTLGILGPEYRAPTADVLATTPGAVDRARRFLVSLARWTRRPAEWALLPPARRGASLTVLGAPRPVAARPPRLAPPDGPTLVQLPERSVVEPPPSPPAGGPRGAPGWVQRQGLRALQLGSRPRTGAALDSLLAFLEAGAFNALWSVVAPAAADSIAKAATARPALRAGRYPLVERLQETSVSWFPGLELRGLAPRPDSTERGLAGDTLPAPCALDPKLWSDALGPAYLALGRLAATEPELVAGIALDLDAPEATYGTGAGFCDATYRAGLAGLGRDSTWTRRFAALPLAVRYDSLLASGTLEAYYAALERQVAVHAAALRAEVLRLRPDVLFALRTPAPPADWFGLGLLRGFGGAEAPVFLWTSEPRTGGLLPVYRARGINVMHALALDPARLRARDWLRLGPLVFGASEGFWIVATPSPSDSLAHLIRRLNKSR